MVELIVALASEGITKDILIHSFYAALMQHQGHSLLSEKLISKLCEVLQDELTDADVVERLRETLDELWDKKSSGVDRYDIPAFLRRTAD